MTRGGVSQHRFKPVRRGYTGPMNIQGEVIPELIFGLSERDVWITDIEVEKPTLEDVFLKIARGDADV